MLHKNQAFDLIKNCNDNAILMLVSMIKNDKTITLDRKISNEVRSYIVKLAIHRKLITEPVQFKLV